jgi:hypothetical protein
MKKIFIIGMFFFLFSSCETYKRARFEYHFGNNDVDWINMYKTQFFFDCLRKGYKDDAFFNSIAKRDLLVPYEPILSYYGRIDTLASKVIMNMPRPIYPHCDDCSEEEEQEDLKKNYICASCLNYYASREFDSIVKKAYRDYVKAEKESVLAN